MCVTYLQSLRDSVLLLLLLQQLLNVCLQFVCVCVSLLLQVCVSPLLFLQALLQNLDLVLLNHQLGFLQNKPAFVFEADIKDGGEEGLVTMATLCSSSAVALTTLRSRRRFLMACCWRRKRSYSS